jgi:proteasome lid subunit RPN8/RPN11
MNEATLPVPPAPGLAPLMGPATIHMRQRTLAAMLAHARSEAPRECCGLLTGTATRIEESVPTANLEQGTTRFLVDPAAHFALLKRLRGTPYDVIGAYHSHPRSPAAPSPTDIAESFADSLLCVIVSLADEHHPVTRAYRIRGDVAEEIEITIDDNE